LASTGRSRSRRAQKEWMVPAKRRSSPASALRIRASLPRRFGAAKALFERKLESSPELRRGLACEGDRRHVLDVVDPLAIPAAMRLARLWVFPEPAPAFHEEVRSSRDAIRSRAS